MLAFPTCSGLGGKDWAKGESVFGVGFFWSSFFWVEGLSPKEKTHMFTGQLPPRWLLMRGYSTWGFLLLSHPKGESICGMWGLVKNGQTCLDLQGHFRASCLEARRLLTALGICTAQIPKFMKPYRASPRGPEVRPKYGFLLLVGASRPSCQAGPLRVDRRKQPPTGTASGPYPHPQLPAVEKGPSVCGWGKATIT